MKKITIVFAVLVALTLHAKDYETINMMACQNYVGTLRKLVTVQDKGSITIEADTATITSCGVTRSYSIVSRSNRTYELDNGSRLVVNEKGKQIKLDVKDKPSAKFYSYTYIYNLK